MSRKHTNHDNIVRVTGCYKARMSNREISTSMSRKDTNHNDTVRVVICYKAGMNNREISKQIQVNEKTVSRLIAKFKA